MANLLTIIKEPNDYFTFVLNGDVANAIKNTRNDLLTIGDVSHFKTSQGANLIKEQNIPFNNVKIVNGATSLVPISVDDLFIKLISVGFFDWINGAGGIGGVNRFDDLLDTFKYFGKDGQGIRVNESQLKLEPYVLPNTSYLDYFPSNLITGKILVVNQEATAYEFVDPFNIITQQIREDYLTTAPSEDAVFKALKVVQESIINRVPPRTQIVADGVQTNFSIGTSAIAVMVFWNGVPLSAIDWTQSGNEITLNFVPELNSLIQII